MKIISKVYYTEQWSARGQEDHLCLHTQSLLKRCKATGTNSCPSTGTRGYTVLKFVLYARVTYYQNKSVGMAGSHAESA